MKTHFFNPDFSRRSINFFPLLLFLTVTANVLLAAPNGPGWITRSMAQKTETAFGSPLQALSATNKSYALTPAFKNSQTAAAAWTFSEGEGHRITPELQALADGLGRDPLRIFNWVRKNISYSPYFGCRKGATLTFLERSGNDLDICALLVSLLRAAGYQSYYQWGVTQVPKSGASGTWLASWLGVSPGYESARLEAGGYPPGYLGIDSDGRDPETIYQLMVRAWVAVIVEGNGYWLDPVFKNNEASNAINWNEAIGFEKTVFLNSGDPNGYLNGRINHLRNWLTTNQPNRSPRELLGKPRIAIADATEIANQNQTFPHGTTSGFSIETWTTLPEDLHSLLRIRCGTNDLALRMAELGGQRLTATFESENRFRLWLDDTLLTSGTVPLNSDGTYALTTTVTHPNLVDTFDQQEILHCRTNSTQTILYAFEPGVELLRQRNEKLDMYRRQGLATESREIVSETLNVLGQSWLRQTRLFADIVADLAHRSDIVHHRIGRASQEANTFVDVGLQIEGSSARNAQASPSLTPQLLAESFVASALEHGIFRQLQGPTHEAASTVRVLALSPSNFLATRNSWLSVRPQLSGYSSGQIATLEAAMSGSSTASEGAVTLLPQSGQVMIEQWRGAGYAICQYSPLETRVTMAISGGLNGGFRSTPGPPDPLYPLSTYNAGTLKNSTPATVPRVTGADPVDLVSGQFTLDTTDLVLGGGTLPRGIALTRSYHGSQRLENFHGLGFGWRHNLDIRIVERSETEAALGEGTAEQMLPAIVAAWTLLELGASATEANTVEWLHMVHVARWFEESLRQNAISINLGGRTLQFLKLPDGSYLGSPGIPHTLTKDSQGRFVVTERHGNTYRFDTQNRLWEAEDLWGEKAAFTYTGGDRLDQVTDCYGRFVTFHYTDQRLASVSDSTGRTVAYGINDSHLVSATDPEGKSDRFEYDTAHRLIRQRDHDNRVIVENTAFDVFDRVIEQRSQGLAARTWRLFYSPGCTIEEDPKGGRTCHLFDEKNRPVGRVDALNRKTEALYDGEHHVVRTRTHLGFETMRIFDAFHNLLKVTDPANQKVTYNYDGLHRLTEVLDQRTNRTTFRYNSGHQPIAITNALQEITINTYRASGELETVTNPALFTTTYNYDNFGNQIRTTFPDEAFVSARYNNRGDRISATDERGHTNTFTFNLRRELIATTFPDGGTTFQDYDNARNLASSTDPLRRTNSYVYSPTRKLLVTILPGGGDTVTNTYDERDWLVEINDPLGSKTATQFNLAGQPTMVTDPLGRTSQTVYDGDARAQVNADPQELGTFRVLNSRGEVTASHDVAGRTTPNNWIGIFETSFRYDAAGNQTARTNRNGHSWEFTYDELNRLVRTRTPLAREIAQTWNNNNLLSTVTEPSQQTTMFHYDERSRLTNQAGPGYSLNLTWDATGNVIRQSEAVGGPQSKNVSRKFDSRNRVTNYTNAAGDTLGYIWDAAGQLTRLTYPDGRQIQYDYDNRGRVQSVTDWSNRVTVLDWDAAGRLKRLTRPNGTSRLLLHDEAGQLIRLEERLPNGRLIALQRFGYDSSGRITNKFCAPVPKPFTEPNVTASYDPDDRLLTYGAQTINHDSDGNLTAGPLPDGPWGPSSQSTNATGVFTWDARNRLTSVARVGAGRLGETSFGYSPDGYLDTITRGNQVEHLVVDPHSASRTQVLERLLADTERIRYVHAPVVGLLYEEHSDGSLRFYHYDQVGSTIALTDDAARITARVEYTAYGALSHVEGEALSLNTPFLYNGRVGVYTDPHTGLLQMRARFYNPHLRRFLSTDPAGFAGGPNFYSYANGDPILYNDPFGLGADEGKNSEYWLRTAASIGVGLIPLVGTIQSLVELASGRDYISGESTSRWLAGVGVFAGLLPGGKAIVKTGAKVLSHTDEIVDVVKATKTFTKSNLQLGQQIHRAYKYGLDDGIHTFKEFRLPSGRRIDFLDIENGIIHELKPNNPRAIRAGESQLQQYLQELQSLPQFQGINWRTVLDTY